MLNDRLLKFLFFIFRGMSLTTLISLPFAINSLTKYSSSSQWLPILAEVTLWKRGNTRGPSRGSNYALHFEYKYFVNEQSYTSSTVSAYAFPFKANLPSKKSKTITVYVNPDNHAQAIVIPGVIRTWVGIFFFPSIYVLLILVSKAQKIKTRVNYEK